MRRMLILTTVALLVVALASCGGGGTPPIDEFTRLTAQVTDGNGNALTDLAVRVEGRATGVVTDGTGNFSLNASAFPNGVNSTNEMSFGRNGVVMGTYDVVPATNPSLVIKFGDDVPAVEIGQVSGVVFDIQTEAPLTGVEINLFSDEGGVYSAMTGLDGYDIIGVPAGLWSIAASKEGYYSEMAMVEVVAGETTIQHLAMTPNGKVNPGQGLLVSGTLTDSETNAPIAGATVTMYCDTGMMYPCYDDVLFDMDVAKSVEVGTATRGSSMAAYLYDPSYQETMTDASGHFTFEEEVVGYMIWLDYYADGYLNGNHYEDIYDQTGSLNLNLTMDSFVETSMHGVVLNDVGEPIPGAFIELIWAGEQVYGDPIAMPGAGVDWEFMVDESRNSDLGAPAPPMMPGVDGGDWDDVATGGFQYDEGTSSGPNVDNETMMRFRWDNQQDSHATSDIGGFNGYFSGNADENGEFTFDGMPAGEYYLFASAYRHIPVSNMLELSENPAENEEEIVLEPVPVGAVEGVVTDEHGNPIPDCLVNATQPNVDPFTYTDATGYFLIENVPAGTWFISGYKVGYLTESVQQEILEDQTMVVNLVLESYTAPETDIIQYSGEVIDGTEASKLAGVDIVFTPVDNLYGSYYQHIVSNATGAYSCILAPTEYNVLLQKEGYEDIFIRIWVDEMYPTMDFWMWPINSGQGGGWGGWMEPMLVPAFDGAPADNAQGGDGMPEEMPDFPPIE